MAGKIVNPDFFKGSVKLSDTKADTPAGDPDAPEKSNKVPEVPKPPVIPPVLVEPQAQPDIKTYASGDKVWEMKAADSSVRINSNIEPVLKELDSLLISIGQKSLTSETARIRQELVRRRFTVAVAGEFSKGKSTFINTLLGRDILPTGNLPTTAMLTKIRYNPKEMLICFDKNGKKRSARPLAPEAWDNLTAGGSEADPDSIVLAGVNSPWLCKTGIELEDTPGAGDLEEKRAAILAEALRSDDGAIITISATAAMSMSEMLFIEQRFISPKTPYLMLIITKLDMIPVDERNMVVQYIIDKLRYKKWNIPVFIPNETEMPDDRFSHIMGCDKIKKILEAWVHDPERAFLTKTWLNNKVTQVIDIALDSLKEQEKLCDADDSRRAELIAEKKSRLSSFSTEWEKLKLEMEVKNRECYQSLLDIIDDNRMKITDKLQYEASHANSPERWWRQDYPYRLKVELMNLSGILDNFVNRRLTTVEKTVIDNVSMKQNIQFEDINKKRNIVRVGTTAAMIVGSIAMASLGAMPLIATYGIGTGSSIISEKKFREKIEDQQRTMMSIIESDVPEVITKATAQTESNLKAKYGVIISYLDEEKNTWLKAQEQTIENSMSGAAKEQREKIIRMQEKLSELRSRLR